MKLNRSVLFGLLVLFTLLVAMTAPTAVLADDQTPPLAPTEEPVSPPQEEPNLEEQHISEPVSGILEQLPEETQLVVLNENGNAEPLVTEEAAAVMGTGDPVWCPSTLSAPTPGANGCTSSHTSFQDLLDDLAANQPSQAGVIWIEKTYDSSVNDPASTGFTIDGSSLIAMKDHALTLQGGWNGIAGVASVDHNDPSVFDGDYLHIVNWNADVTINDISVKGVISSTPAVEVTTSGDISIKRVNSGGNVQNGATLDNASGSGVIQVIYSRFNGNSGGSGLIVNSNGAITLSSVTASGNGVIGAYLNNTASVNGDHVVVSGANYFNNNELFGLVVLSDGDILLRGVNANGNGGNIPVYSGVIFDTLANAAVCNSNFSGNAGYGLEASLLGTLSLGNNGFIGNGSGAFDAFGGARVVQDAQVCGPYLEKVRPETLGLHVVLIDDGASVDLDCGQFSGTVLVLPVGDKVTFKCPITGSGTLSSVGRQGLPGPLPEGLEYISGLTANQSPAGSDRKLDAEVIVSFLVPENMLGEDLAILYWNGNEWLDLHDAKFNDGRSVFSGGSLTGQGYFEAITNFSGTFLLVQK